MDILLKFESEEDKWKWVNWYIEKGEKFSKYWINYDLNGIIPWEVNEEQLVFEMKKHI